MTRQARQTGWPHPRVLAVPKEPTLCVAHHSRPPTACLPHGDYTKQPGHEIRFEAGKSPALLCSAPLHAVESGSRSFFSGASADA